MDLLPAVQEQVLMVFDDRQRPAEVVAFEAHGRDELYTPVAVGEVDLCMSVSEHMDMSGLMIVENDHESQALRR
jgi:hypothetical protein